MSMDGAHDADKAHRRNEEPTEKIPGGGAPATPPSARDASHRGDTAPHLDSSRISHERGVGRSLLDDSAVSDEEDTGADADEDGGDRPDECPNRWTLTRKKRLPSGEVRKVYIPQDCWRQGCPYCGPKLRRRKVAHFCRVFSDLADEGYTLLFCSFTLDPKLRVTDTVKHCGQKMPLSIPQQENYLRQVVWDKFWKRMRYWLDDYHYAGAMESHEDGRPHLHVMIAVKNSEGRSWRELNALIREHWFESGGGAVMDVKAPKSPNVAAEGEDTRGLDGDGRPGSMSGCVGYICKYMQESAEKREERKDRGRDSQKKPNMVLCSQGIGYDSRAAKLRRKAVARGIDEPTEEDINRIAREEAEGESEYEYETPFDNESQEYAPGAAAQARKYRREYFREYVTDEETTQKYRNEVVDHPEYGRTVWEVYTYTEEGVRREVYDRFPEDDRADLIDIDPAGGLE